MVRCRYIMTCSVTNRAFMTDILPARMLKLHVRGQVFFSNFPWDMTCSERKQLRSPWQPLQIKLEGCDHRGGHCRPLRIIG